LYLGAIQANIASNDVLKVSNGDNHMKCILALQVLFKKKKIKKRSQGLKKIKGIYMIYA
jgi:hypothetical protein